MRSFLANEHALRPTEAALPRVLPARGLANQHRPSQICFVDNKQEIVRLSSLDIILCDNSDKYSNVSRGGVGASTALSHRRNGRCTRASNALDWRSVEISHC